jgi:hypothetical protein
MIEKGKLVALRELRPEEIELVAGGDGPTAAESVIEGMYENAGPLDAGDETWARMENGMFFSDEDGNGFYDYVELPDEGGAWVWDSAEGVWDWHDYPDEPEDEDFPDDRDVEGGGGNP